MVFITSNFHLKVTDFSGAFIALGALPPALSSWHTYRAVTLCRAWCWTLSYISLAFRAHGGDSKLSRFTDEEAETPGGHTPYLEQARMWPLGSESVCDSTSWMKCLLWSVAVHDFGGSLLLVTQPWNSRSSPAFSWLWHCTAAPWRLIFWDHVKSENWCE